MSPGIALLIVIIAVIVAVAVGTKTNINMGLFAFVFAAILAGFVFGISPRTFYSWWPTNIMLQIIGVTFFFGYVGESGAIKVIADRMLHLVRNKMPLIPFVFFILATVLGLLGVNPMGINALCLPIIASICMYTNLNPAFLFISYGTGAMAGVVSPLGSAGIVASGMVSGAAGAELASSIMPRVYFNNFLLNFICFIVVYIAFRGWKLNVSEENRAVFHEKPAPATREQKIVLIVMLVAVLVMVVPSVLGIQAISSALDVGWVYLAAGVVCALLKISDLRQVITQRIPWSIIILVGGFSILLSIATQTGGFDLIASWVSENVPTAVISPAMAVLGGITSLFSDSIGVVFPLYIPVSASLLSTGVSATAIFSSTIIGTLVTGCAPFSTGGAMMLSFAPKEMERKLFWYSILFAFIYLVLTAIVSVIGLFG